MKKKLLLLGFLLLFPITANAANAKIDLSVSNTSVSLGNNITVTANVNSDSPIGYYEYTLDYDHSKLELTSGNSYNTDRANNGETKSFKKEFKFKVKDSSSTKISVKSYAVSTYRSEESMSVTVNPVYINSSNHNGSNTSDDNYLASLSIDGYSLEPAFKKNTTSYILKIEDDIDEINIKATASSKNASITGDGKRTIKQGENRIEIVVTSESGNDRTYTIKVTLTEKNPIKFKIDGKEYTVVKNIESFNKLEGYEIKKIKIDNKDVQALYNKVSKITLVALKDENGKTALYMYDGNSDTYSPYNEISGEKLSILPLTNNKKLSNYSLYTETINNNDIDCYKISSNSNYCVIYGMNVKTGEEGFYIYDLKENTIQKYNYDLDEYYQEKIKNTKVLIYILSSTTLLFGIMTIIFAVKSNKRR